MKLVLFSTPDAFADESALLGEMFEQGLEVLHLRKPTWQRDAVAALVESIPVRFYNRIVLHTHYELVREYGLRGIHLPEVERARNPACAEQWKESGAYSVSTSLHTLAALHGYDPVYDYVMLSPVFDSISKQGYRSAFSVDDVRRAVHQSSYAVIALGGVCTENIHELQAMGFAGAAVLGAVWHSDNPVQACTQLLSCVAQ